MADFKLTGKVIITEAAVSKLAREKLKGIKITLDTGRAGQNLKKLTKNLDQAKTKANALSSELARAGSASKSLQKVSQGAKKTGESLDTATQRGQDMIGMFENIGRRALAFRVAATFINAFTDAIDDATGFLRELDQVMTDVAKITGITSEEFGHVTDRLIEIGNATGTAVDEMTGQFRTFIQAGFDTETALQAVERAAEGAAATTLNFEQATSLLIQSMKVFGNLGAADVFSKMAIAESNAAVTAEDIQEALKRAGGTFRAVNASLDDAIGLISALQEVSRRGGAVIGTAWRTINTRIFAGDTRKAVEELGVAVTDSQGRLRSLVSVLSDLSVRFDSLTEAERVQAATTIAGRRQFESFVQILNTVDRAQSLSAQSAQSLEEAQRRAKIQSESLDGILTQLRNNFLKAVKDTNQLLPIVDVFKAMAKALSEVAEVSGGAIGQLTGIVAAVSALKVAPALLKGFGRALGKLGVLPRGLGAGGLLAGVGGAISPGGMFGRTLTVPEITGKQSVKGIQTKGISDAIKRFRVLNIAALAGAAALGSLSTNLDGWTKTAAELGSTFLSLTAILGPIPALFATAGVGIYKTIKSIIGYNEANDAFYESLEREGIPAVAELEMSIVKFANAGDSAAVDLLRNAQELERAKFKISDTDIAESARVAFQGVLLQLRNLSPGVEAESSKLREKLINALIKTGDFTQKQAQELFGDFKMLLPIFEQLGFQIKDFSEAGVNAWEQIINQVNEVQRELGKGIVLVDVNKVFNTGALLSSATKLKTAIKEANLANEIWINGITDANIIRKKEAALAVELAEDNATIQRRVLRESIKAFGEETGLDIGPELNKIFEEISKSGRDFKEIDLADVIERISKMAGKADKSLIGQEEALNKLLASYTEWQSSLLDVNNAIREDFQVKTVTAIEDTIKALEESRTARLDEIDAMQSIQDILRGVVDVTGITMRDVGSSFRELMAALHQDFSADELIKTLGVIEDLEDPIKQSRMETENLIKAGIDNIESLDRQMIAYRESINTLMKWEGVTKDHEEVLKLEAKIQELAKEADFERARTLKSVAQQLKKTRELEKKAIEDLMKAQREVTKSFDELKSSLEEAATESLVESQENLQSAQMNVIEATEDLAEAYEELRAVHFSLGDSVADYRLGIELANRQIDIITGRIRGFSQQLMSIQNVYDQIINNTAITETKRLELLKQSASEQLQLIEGVIQETKSIGQRLFTAAPGTGTELIRGFSAIQDILGQFTAAGGFGGIDLNQFGNQLLALPQSIREEIVQALGFLPETATLGGFTKKEIEDVLFGSAVGESQEANIQNISDLTEQQIVLISQIAELDKNGLFTSQQQLVEAQKQVALAESALDVQEINLDRAEENFESVRKEISTTSNILKDAQHDVGQLLSSDITMLQSLNLESIQKRFTEHQARLQALQNIDTNTANLGDALSSFATALSALPVAGAAKGHIPANFATGNMREVAGLIKAYNREKRMGPTGAKPVVANDSELIIPTKNKGHVPNFQGGNAGKLRVESPSIEGLLESILEEVRNQMVEGPAVAAAAPAQRIEANINVNADQQIRLSGAASIADAVASAVRREFGNFATNDQIKAISEQMMDFFQILQTRGLVNILGQG